MTFYYTYLSVYVNTPPSCYNKLMKFVLLAIGGFVLLLIINTFLGGDPL